MVYLYLWLSFFIPPAPRLVVSEPEPIPLEPIPLEPIPLEPIPLEPIPLSLMTGRTSLCCGEVLQGLVCDCTGREKPLLMWVLMPSLACSTRVKHSLSI